MVNTHRSAFASYAGPQKKPVIDRELLRELSRVAEIENQACARKVELAAHIWDSCIHQNVAVGDVIMDAGNYAASETAKILGCSKTVADTLAGIGMDLRLRMPAVKAAFDAGEIDLARVRAIYRTTNRLTLEAAERVETEVLHAARRLSPGPLATEINNIMHRTAPEEAAEIRKDLARLTRVRYRDRDLIATIDADLEAGDAAACWQLINEMANTVCKRDPRTCGQRRAAAYVAIMRQESYLPCTCEVDEDNPCEATRELPDRRAPLTMVNIDLTTLVGLTNLPGYLAGHGVIDADYARELANNGDWQILLTEAVKLQRARDSRKQRGQTDDHPDAPTTEPGTAGDSRSRAAAGGDGGEQLSADAAASADSVMFHPLGRGRRRPAGRLPKPIRSATSSSPTPISEDGSTSESADYEGAYTFIARLEEAIAADPTLAAAVHADGHGGFMEPPPGALTYRPGAALADCVRQRDRTCRHPGCDVPAAQCEIDHLVPCLQHDAKQGGWTILTNLHCLCRYHHSLKTMGVWIPVMLEGGVVHWTSSSGTTAVTLPGNTIGSDLSGSDLPSGTLIPRIPRKRRPKTASPSIADTSTASATSDARTGREPDAA